jgi:hypothetical protein
MVIWMMSLAVAVCAMIITAAIGNTEYHMAVTGVISLMMALWAVQEHLSLARADAPQTAIGASTAKSCGLIWAWGTLSLLATYGFMLGNKWPEWWQFTLGFGAAAIACLWFANIMTRDAASGQDDADLLRMGRIMLMVQIVGVLAALVTMLIEGKFPRSAAEADWAGINIFLFGGLAIIAISINALRTTRSV